MDKDELFGRLWVYGFFLFGICLGVLSGYSTAVLALAVGYGIFKLIFSRGTYNRDDAGFWLAVVVFGAITTLGSGLGQLLRSVIGRLL